MTKIDEGVFAVELPGDWGPVEGGEPGTLVYCRTEGSGILTVVLLSVRPMFAIADRERMLADYVHHRSNYELGQTPGLESSEPDSSATDDGFETTWSARDAASGKWRLHRAVLAQDLLVDFCYETAEADPATFEEEVSELLGAAKVSPGRQAPST